MKLLKPVNRSKVPSRTPGTGDRSNSSDYDSITSRVLKLADDKVLPIECDSQEESVRVMASLRKRGLDVLRRGNVVYASRPWSESTEKGKTK